MTQKRLEGRDWTGRPLERSEIRRTVRKASKIAQNGLREAAQKRPEARGGPEAFGKAEKRLEVPLRATWKGPPGQVGLVWARSGRDWPGLGQWFILALMFYQWFTSGLPVVYSSGLLACSSCLAGRSLFFEKEQFDVQIWCF